MAELDMNMISALEEALGSMSQEEFIEILLPCGVSSGYIAQTVKPFSAQGDASL